MSKPDVLLTTKQREPTVYQMGGRHDHTVLYQYCFQEANMYLNISTDSETNMDQMYFASQFRQHEANLIAIFRLKYLKPK